MTDATARTQTTASEAAAEYAAARARDWQSFTSKVGPLASRWDLWAEESFQWRPEISFFQPVGLDYPAFIQPLRPLLDVLTGMEEIDLPPVPFLHLTTARVGFMRADDIIWSQVETFYVNAAPRLHRIPPFKLRIGGISAREHELYFGVDDGHALREVRRQISRGVPKVRERIHEEPVFTAEGDRYVPDVPFAFFTGRGDRRRVIEAVEPYVDVELGEHDVTHVKMGRIAPDPDIHYPDLDVVAEIRLYGEDYRKGYHN